MADIRPFSAIRPRRGMEKDIAALPYDVYSTQEARAAAAGRTNSFLWIDRPEIGFSEGYDMYAPEVYQHAAELLWQMAADGRLVQDQKKAYYLYSQTMNGHEQTGIVACASIDDYEAHVIKKHENTRADKETDRIRHVSACHAQTGPIFLAYRRNDELKELIQRIRQRACDYRFTSEDEITHTGWLIDRDEDIARVTECFQCMKQIYIADGHHRCASAVKVGLEKRRQNPHHNGTEEYNYFLSVLFSDDELSILDYNRVVRDLNGLSEAEFLARLGQWFTITAQGRIPCKPTKKGCFGMYLGDTWYQLVYHGQVPEGAVECLDVSVLQKYCLSGILGIDDPKTGKRIDFVGGIRGMKELERRVHTDCEVAFSLYPTSIEELFEVADHDLLMPPKSTWFEPKLRSGLYIHQIEV